MANNNNNQMPSLENLPVQDGGARADFGEFIMNKFRDLAGKLSRVMGYLSLSPNVKKRVEVLREIQREHDELKEKFLEERAALEAKYQLLYQPLYAKRYEIVNGLAEVEGVAMETAADTEEKGIPCFWLKALKNNEEVADEITYRDVEALKFLIDIRYTKMAEPLGFKLEFFFDPNPYFSNTVLTKTYHMLDEDEPLLKSAFGTVINWLPEMSLTEKIADEEQKKDLKNEKPVIETHSCDSFFNFFNPPDIPENDLDIDEDACLELQTQMEKDYDIGSTIRDKIIPHAVTWFTGEAVDGEGDEDVEDEGNDGEDPNDGLDDGNLGDGQGEIPTVA